MLRNRPIWKSDYCCDRNKMTEAGSSTFAVGNPLTQLFQTQKVRLQNPYKIQWELYIGKLAMVHIGLMRMS